MNPALNSIPSAGPAVIVLPHSSTRAQCTYAHCKLVTRIRQDTYSNTAFEGKIYRPGAAIPSKDLGIHPVLIECVGPIGSYKRGKRTMIEWVLWRYDWHRQVWIELARTQAEDATWTVALRDAAVMALNPHPILYDVMERGRSLTGDILLTIDDKLAPEASPIKLNVWSALYDRVAGRIASLY